MMKNNPMAIYVQTSTNRKSQVVIENHCILDPNCQLSPSPSLNIIKIGVKGRRVNLAQITALKGYEMELLMNELLHFINDMRLLRGWRRLRDKERGEWYKGADQAGGVEAVAKRCMSQSAIKMTIDSLTTDLKKWKPGHDATKFYYQLGEREALIRAYGQNGSGTTTEDLMALFEHRPQVTNRLMTLREALLEWKQGMQRYHEEYLLTDGHRSHSFKDAWDQASPLLDQPRSYIISDSGMELIEGEGEDEKLVPVLMTIFLPNDAAEVAKAMVREYVDENKYIKISAIVWWPDVQEYEIVNWEKFCEDNFPHSSRIFYKVLDGERFTEIEDDIRQGCM